jgi:hypothetical protein
MVVWSCFPGFIRFGITMFVWIDELLSFAVVWFWLLLPPIFDVNIFRSWVLTNFLNRICSIVCILSILFEYAFNWLFYIPIYYFRSSIIIFLLAGTQAWGRDTSDGVFFVSVPLILFCIDLGIIVLTLYFQYDSLSLENSSWMMYAISAVELQPLRSSGSRILFPLGRMILIFRLCAPSSCNT